MPLSIFSLPPHITDSIIQKMEFRDFVNFHQCSQESFQTAMKVKTRFTVEKKYYCPIGVVYGITGLWMQFHGHLLLNKRRYRQSSVVSDLPIRFEGLVFDIRGNFCDEFCDALINFAEITNTYVNQIRFDDIICSPDALVKLVETGKVKELQFTDRISPEYMEIEAINKISNFNIQSMSATDILCFDARKFKIYHSNLSSLQINQILKDLLNGQRIINHCEMGTYHVLDKDVLLEGIPIYGGSSFRRPEIHIGSEGTYKIEIYQNQNINGFEITKLAPSVVENICRKRKDPFESGIDTTSEEKRSKKH